MPAPLLTLAPRLARSRPPAQVGAHMAKDAFSNFVATPLTNQAQDTVLEATGLDGVANQVGCSQEHLAASPQPAQVGRTAGACRAGWPVQACQCCCRRCVFNAAVHNAAAPAPPPPPSTCRWAT